MGTLVLQEVYQQENSEEIFQEREGNAIKMESLDIETADKKFLFP